MKVPLLVGDFLTRARNLYPDAIGVVCGDQRLTYRQLGRRVDRFSTALRARGVAKGDVVAYVSFNCHRLLEAYYAVPQAGAILLPINIRLAPADIAYILEDAGASVAVVDRRLAKLLAPIRAALPALRMVVLMGDDAAQPCELSGEEYEHFIESDATDLGPPRLSEDDIAELFYTSGTTAHPKGVMLTHRNLCLHALFALAGLPGYDDGCVQLHTIPLFHVNGWGTPHFVTLLGGRHVMLPAFDADEVLATIERERVTHVFLVPTMATALTAAPSWRTRDLTSLRRVKIGGAAAAPALIRDLSQRLPDCDVAAGYGLTETSPILTAARLKAGMRVASDAWARVLSTAGLPLPGVSIEILDDRGLAQPHDGRSLGEICVRSNVVTPGYWKRPEETAAAMAGGWFHTGDVGSIDEAGYVEIRDRKKDIVITGGENVSTLEVETALYEHPDVFECAVVGAPDEYWGEVPVAIVVRKPGTTVDEDALLAHCRNRLAGFKVPKLVRFVDSLPKGGTGKILKRELREGLTRART